MRPMQFLLGALAAAGMEIAALLPAAAGALEVAPTTLDVPADAETAMLYLTNRGDAPLLAQIQGFDWSQKDGVAELIESKILTISPPLAELAPGQQQIVRIAVAPTVNDAAPNNASIERAFRLLISELPPPSTTRGVRVLLQFSVPVFKAGAGDGKLHLAWSASRDPGGLVVTARNSGTRHAKLSGLQLATSDGKKHALSSTTIPYVLAGQSMRWTLPVANAKAGDRVRVAGRDDASGLDIGTALDIAK